MKRFTFLTTVMVIGLFGIGRAQDPVPASPINFESWETQLPFSFKYDGKDSTTFLSLWKKSKITTGSAHEAVRPHLHFHRSGH